MVIIALAIKAGSPGPAIFRQKRTGKNGKNFTFYKFRTMVEGAEKLQAKYRHLNETNGPTFKIREDPRLTRVGRLLAHTGLDELPQLVNIIKGEMSFVGPRPLPTEEAAQLTAEQKRREAALPGLTSTWVIRGAHKLPFAEWMRLDAEDVKNSSLRHDLTLIIATGRLVAGSVGHKFKELWWRMSA